MANHIDTAPWMVIDGLLTEAQDVLENEVLETTDGFFNRGVADDDDWITRIEGHVLLYPLVLETIQLLESLAG